jgi:hypothetical protein
MPTKTLQQVVAYISAPLKAKLDQDRARMVPRPTVSRYIEQVLRRHLSPKKGA